MRTTSRAVGPIVALVLIVSTPPVDAQTESPSLLQPTDSALAIVPLRSVEEIDADLALVGQVLDSDRVRRNRAEAAQKSSDRYVRVTENEIKLVEQKIDLADDDDREAEKLALEAEKQALDELKRFHERERELRKAESELAKARIERADAAVKALELEKELAVQRQRNAGSGLASTRQVQVLSELEKKTLEAQKDVFDRDRRVAEREKSVIERRLQLFDARKKLFES